MLIFWRRYILAAVMPLSATFLLWLLRDILTSENFSLVYLLIVLVIAIYQGTGPSLCAALIGFLCFNFFLVTPLYTFLVADPRDLLGLTIYLVSAALTGQLASYARNQSRSAEQRTHELNVVYAAATTFNQLTEPQQVYAALQRVLRERLSAQNVEFLPDLPSEQSDPSHLYVRLSAGEKVYSVLHVVFTRTATPSISQVVAACASHAAVALQRIELMLQAQQSKTFEEADQLKTAILHSVSHDLRTPITIIKTSASNLLRLDGTLSPDTRLETLTGIEAEADHLDKMVGNLLDISRLQAGAIQINKGLNSLEEVVGDVAARVWQITHDERIEIDFPSDMPLVNFDYGLVLQALTNLVENALRYEPTSSHIRIAGYVRGQEAQVALINHGANIAPEEREAIMEPFYHSDSEPRGEHSGLGLAIAKGIIEAHQGRLWIENTPGGGATFILSLPLSQPLVSEGKGQL